MSASERRPGAPRAVRRRFVCNIEMVDRDKRTPGELALLVEHELRGAHPGVKVELAEAPFDEFPRPWFVADGDAVLCGDCNERLGTYDVNDDAVQVWEFWSEGWLGPVVCDSCHASLPVVVDPPKGASNKKVART